MAKNIRLKQLSATGLLCACLMSNTLAQEHPNAVTKDRDYPNRPVVFIVPWPPGDLEDILTHAIATEMTKETQVPAKVENLSGQSGTLGVMAVVNAKPDGYVIGSFVAGLVTTNVLSDHADYKKNDLEPVGIFLDYPAVLAVAASAPYDTLRELATYSQTHHLSMGHYGYQALSTLLAFHAADKLGIRFSSDKSYADQNCDLLLNGDVDVLNTTTQLILPCLKSNQVKLLTSMTHDRLLNYPNVPTLNEETGIVQTLWNGLFVPKGTPKHIKDTIGRIAQKALMSPAVMTLQEKTGAGVYWTNAEDSQRVIDLYYDSAPALLKYIR